MKSERETQSRNENRNITENCPTNDLKSYHKQAVDAIHVLEMQR